MARGGRLRLARHTQLPGAGVEVESLGGPGDARRAPQGGAAGAGEQRRVLAAAVRPNLPGFGGGFKLHG